MGLLGRIQIDPCNSVQAVNVHTWEGAVLTALTGMAGAPGPLTKDVLRALAEAGTALGFYTSATGGEAVGAKWKEWLWDCAWREYQDEKSWALRSVPMVAECEWAPGNQARLHDFEKLLAANAPLRVFVFDGAKHPGYSGEVAGDLCDRIGAMSLAAPDEVRFVIAAWERRPRPGFRIFVVSGEGEILREIAP